MFVTQALASQPVLKRLSSLLEDGLQETLINMKDKENFNKASWPYFQASLLGEQRVYEKVLKLINNITTKEEVK